LSDLCDTDGKADVDEDEGVGDVLVADAPVEEVLVVDGGAVLIVIRLLTTVLGLGDDAVVVIMAVAVAVVGDAVDSGPEGKTLQYVKKPRILHTNSILCCRDIELVIPKL